MVAVFLGASALFMAVFGPETGGRRLRKADADTEAAKPVAQTREAT
jgi:hypothetical protein